MTNEKLETAIKLKEQIELLRDKVAAFHKFRSEVPEENINPTLVIIFIGHNGEEKRIGVDFDYSIISRMEDHLECLKQDFEQL